MVERNDQGEWYLTQDADLGIVARECETAGALARQKRAHARQRALQARALERGN